MLKRVPRVLFPVAVRAWRLLAVREIRAVVPAAEWGQLTNAARVQTSFVKAARHFAAVHASQPRRFVLPDQIEAMIRVRAAADARAALLIVRQAWDTIAKPIPAHLVRRQGYITLAQVLALTLMCLSIPRQLNPGFLISLATGPSAAI